jgi:hypothetical protein
MENPFVRGNSESNLKLQCLGITTAWDFLVHTYTYLKLACAFKLGSIL